MQEIERKFLVHKGLLPELSAFQSFAIKQAYL